MNRRNNLARFLLTLAMCLMAGVSSALEFSIAPIVFIEKVESGEKAPNIAREILNGLNALDFQSEITFTAVFGAEAPMSQLEAVQLGMDSSAEYLFYGFVRQDVDSLSAEIKLLDVKKRSVMMTFYASDRVDQRERMIQDILRKIEYYIRNDLGFAEKAEAEEERDIWGIEGGLGYWTPANRMWLDYMIGVVSIEFGGKFIPVKPNAVLAARELYYIIGANVEYSIGLNQPGFESSVLHSANINVSVEAAYDLTKRQRFGLLLEAGLRMDLLVQNRLYQGTAVSFSPVPEISGALEYAFALNKNMELGCELKAGMVLVNRPLWRFTPKIVYTYWFGEGK